MAEGPIAKSAAETGGERRSLFWRGLIRDRNLARGHLHPTRRRKLKKPHADQPSGLASRTERPAPSRKGKPYEPPIQSGCPIRADCERSHVSHYLEDIGAKGVNEGCCIGSFASADLALVVFPPAQAH